MKAKRFLALFVVLVMVFALVTACGGNGDTTPTPANTPTPAPVQTPAPTPEPIVEDPVEVTVEFPDLGGRTIRIGTWSAGGFFGETGDERPDPAEDANYFINSMRWDNRVRVEEAFNVQFEIIALGWGEVITSLTSSVLAGEPFADLVHLPGPHSFTALNTDLVLPLDTLARSDSDFMTTRNWLEPRAAFDGHVWSVHSAAVNTGQEGIGVNLDIIDAMGAPNPVELYERGEWTWDAMRQVMEMTTADTTGDGVNDTFGFSGSLQGVIRHLISANDGWMICPDTLTYAYDSENTMVALEFVYEILANGWFFAGDPEHAMPVRAHVPNQRAFEQGRNALHGAIQPFHINRAINEGFTARMAFVPFPIGPNSTANYTSNIGLRDGVHIPVGTEDAAYVLWILEELFAWPGDDYYLLNEGGIDGLRNIFEDEGDVQRVLRNAENAKQDIGFILDGYYWFHNDLVEAWYLGTMTVAQAVEYFRQPQQDRINTFFGLD